MIDLTHTSEHLNQILGVDNMELLAVGLLFFLFGVYAISTLKQTETKTHEPPNTNKKKGHFTETELIDSLNWLLMHQIIDNQQYNNLILKSVPYLK